jgi:mRNA-degrading endonuclease RelE of RelBE toxin-antitoxin system
MVTILQLPSFKRSFKKFHHNQQKIIEDIILYLSEEPTAGTMKKGDLQGIRVYKFRISRQQYLLAYSFYEEKLILELIEIDTHENFYRDLKRS